MANTNGKQSTEIINKIYDQMIKAADEAEKPKQKNIILFVGKIQDYSIDAIRAYCKANEKEYKIGLIYDPKKLDSKTEALLGQIDLTISCSSNSAGSIQKALLPYQDELMAVTCRAEDKIPMLAQVIPHIPYLNMPTSESLIWASDKILMRKRLFNFNKELSPPFAVISDTTPESLAKIEAEVGFPLIVKPAGLAASRLVSICFHKEELEEVLTKTFKKMDSVYKDLSFTGEPKVLVERFMDGEMYSIDGYVTSKGKTSFCPLVHVKTGKSIGFDDFFGYQQITPTILKKESVLAAEFVAEQAVHAMALRSTTVHIEIMRTEGGWKVIELGARAGGFRHMMYSYSFDINHTMNDVLVHMGEKTIIPKKIKGYTVAMKFFAKKEGTLTKLTGIKKIQELESFKSIDINKNVGDQCLFAKSGGSSVFNLIMFNKQRSSLLADIRRVEQMIEIETE